MVRLDKFLSEMGVSTRTQTKKAVRAGAVSVNGVRAASSDMKIDEEKDKVVYFGEEIVYERFTYVMLNKPQGYISATDDPKKKTVLELLPERLASRGLFPCGRLDIDTTGLLILTNDGQLAHSLLSPKRHADKVYRFKTDVRLPADACERMREGIVLEDGYECLPADLALDEVGCGGYITLREGKFHQIKRMTAALGAETVELERVSFAGVQLDSSLARGEFRMLTDDEIALLEKYRI